MGRQHYEQDEALEANASDLPDHLQFFVPAYLKQLVDDPTTDDIELFIEVDMKSGREYIPVFAEFSDAEGFVMDHSGLMLDKHLCIYAFPSLVAAKKRFKTAFGRPIKIILFER